MIRLKGTIPIVGDYVALAENSVEILGEGGYSTAWTDSAEAALAWVAAAISHGQAPRSHR